MVARNLLLDKYTKLDNRKLLFDGDSVVNMEFMYGRLLGGHSLDPNTIHPKKINKEVESYNLNFDTSLTLKQSIKKYDHSWNIPKKYRDINIQNYVDKKLNDELDSGNFTKTQMRDRKERTQLEIDLWDDSNLNDLFKTLIYIIDVFKTDNVVWGTGRGSSCCCYILYLIELHDVDSIMYDLNLKEFFRS